MALTAILLQHCHLCQTITTLPSLSNHYNTVISAKPLQHCHLGQTITTLSSLPSNYNPAISSKPLKHGARLSHPLLLHDLCLADPSGLVEMCLNILIANSIIWFGGQIELVQDRRAGQQNIYPTLCREVQYIEIKVNMPPYSYWSISRWSTKFLINIKWLVQYLQKFPIYDGMYTTYIESLYYAE